VPLRHGRMLSSAFAFYRGGAAIMARDLASTPTTSLRAQLCGDAHLVNFGLFDSPERSLVFDLNDFDETLPGPFEWDVKRLAASMEIAGEDLGLTPPQRHRATSSTVRAYREAMASFAQQPTLDVWYARLAVDELLARLDAAGGDLGHEVHKRARKAMARNHLGAFERLLEVVDGEPRFISTPPVVVPAEELLSGEARDRYVEVVHEALSQYRESLPDDRRALVECYRFVALARKVVGVGSVGTRCWVGLFQGRDAGDPLLLQMKEAQPSVLAPYAGPSRYTHQGRRVVEGQRAMQAAGDHLLGWYRIRAWDEEQRDFFIRQLWDGKASVDVTRLSATGLARYGAACGWTLARAHARTGDRVAIAAYLGETDEFERAMCEFAAAYAATNHSDWELLGEAVSSHRMQATEG